VKDSGRPGFVVFEICHDYGRPCFPLPGETGLVSHQRAKRCSEPYRHGKTREKQALYDRIMAILSDEEGSKLHRMGNKNLIGRDEVAKIIDDIYRKMHGAGASDLASKNQNGPSLNAIVRSDVIGDTVIPESKTCCPCGSSMDSDTMIQCDETKCGVWQHVRCVIVPEKPVESVQPEIPLQFYCDICRINRGDPFCVTLAQPLLPTKLITTAMTVDGANPSQTVEKTFELRRTDRDLLHKQGYDLQVWCILLNDKVPFRMHWPQHADLRVNGIAVRVTNRPAPQLLGANGRDDGPGITACSREGTNRISLQAYDSRPFVLGVRIIRRRTVEQVLNLIPNQSEGEPFEEALSRVCRCVGGGGSLENADDSDNDLEVVAESVTVNLRCPMSGTRIKVAGRFKPCIHMGCFDLESFVELSQRTRKWQCPICMENYSVDSIIIDPYFNCVTTFMKSYPEDVTEVEVKPDASWRPKLEGDARLREHWHRPDGSIIIVDGEVAHQQGNLNQVKCEGTSEGHMPLKIGIKRNQDGYWELSGAIPSSTANTVSRKKRNVPPVSNSATDTNGDDEDPSVNQEGSENIDLSANNGSGFDSPFLGCNQTLQTTAKHVGSELPKNSEVIVLSDSEEENADDVNIGSSTVSAFAGSDTFGRGVSVPLNSHEALQEASQIDCNGIPFIPPNSALPIGSFSEGIPPQHSINSPLGFIGASSAEFSEFNLSNWAPHTQNAAFRFFGTNTDVSDSSQCAPVVRPTPVNRYGLLATQQQENTRVGPTIPDFSRSLDSSLCSLNTERNGDLNNSPRVDALDAPIQFFPPPQPAQASVQTDYREPVIPCDDVHWISLSLGSSNNLGKTSFKEPAAAARSRQQSAPEGDGLHSLATASVLLNMSDNRTDGASGDNQGSDSPLRHQRVRSTRPRLYLSVDSDSE